MLRGEGTFPVPSAQRDSNLSLHLSHAYLIILSKKYAIGLLKKKDPCFLEGVKSLGTKKKFCRLGLRTKRKIKSK